MKLIKKITIPLLVISSAFAQNIEHNLEFTGDTISKSLIRNNYIQDKNDTKTIKEVLKFNQLNWEKARKLPVGFIYYIQGENTPVASNQATSSDSQSSSKESNQLSFEVGTFHHTQRVDKVDIFSDLSQYLIFEYTRSNSYKLSANLSNYKYSADQDQNIENDENQIRYDISLFKVLNSGTFTFNLGAYSKSILLGQIDELNRVQFENAASTGIEARAQSNFYERGNLQLFAGLSAQKNVAADSIQDFFATEINTGSNFKYLKRDLSVILRYRLSQISNKSFNRDNKTASIGLSTIF